MPLSLNDWLARLESLHPKAIDMGLERVTSVAQRLGLHFDCPVITVGGTNGKGSTCAMLESMLLQGGYRVGLYTSPHLLHFNERARLNGELATDAMLCECFEQVEAVRADVSLTYFEFTTLAILKLFANAGLDAVILEVGLGGRLDAVNIIDADVAIVTSVDLDHMDYLGDTREQIGVERRVARGLAVEVVGTSPPAAELPGAEPDDREVEVRCAEASRLHGYPFVTGVRASSSPPSSS